MVTFAVTGATSGTAGASASAGAGLTGGAVAADRVRAQEWWLAALNAPQAWQDARGGGVTVAVLSTGVAADAPDLSGSVITGPDYTASGRNQGGPYWGLCGTAVASIIAGHGHGAGGNSGVIGIAPQAKILSVRVNLEYNDPLNTISTITGRLPGAIATGIMYAVSHGARVIDLPLDPATFGLSGDAAARGGSAAEQSAIRYALARNVVLVSPAGDDGAGVGQLNYPAAYPGVLAVGATSHNGQIALFSSRRSYVALTAPGVGLLTASMVPGGVSGYVPGYSRISTTSVASAMAAGAAALIVSRYPDLSLAQVTQSLRQGATGTGSVNAANAMRAAAALAAAMKPAATTTPASVHPRPVAPPVNHATAAPRAASDVADSVLRDAVFGLGALIVLVVAVLFVTRARRKRTAAAVNAVAAGAVAVAARPVSSGSSGSSASSAHARARGLHEHRRQSRATGEPGDEQVKVSLRQLAQPGSSAANGWPAPSDWQGRSLGEVAHSSQAQSSLPQPSLTQSSLHQPPLAHPPLAHPPLAHPPLAQPPLAQPPLGRPAIAPLPKSATRARQGSGNPPWAPAPEPDGIPAPFAALDSGSSLDDTSSGIRIPGDMPPPLTGPFAGRDVLTQASFGFAAAPVPADYLSPLEVTHADADESTEVFPVVPGFGEEPDIAQPEED
jgi:hypothetical protein